MDQEEATRKSALGLNLSALTVSSGGDCTSTSFIGFSFVPRPREFVAVEVDPNVLNDDVPPKDLLVEPNISSRAACSPQIKWQRMAECSVFSSTGGSCVVYGDL